MKIVRTRRGARMVDGRDVLSEIRASPGPTHSLFDILAASIAGLARGPRCAMLGFAGGGVIAPLRALGFEHPVHAVDLSRQGEALFRELCGAWAGDVRFSQADAADWLRRSPQSYDVVLEDLTVPAPGGAVKPYISIDELPPLVADRLTPDGVVIVNLLPYPGMSWPELIERVASAHADACVVECIDFENRLVIAGPGLPSSARAVASILRNTLRKLGSRQATRTTVHRLP